MFNALSKLAVAPLRRRVDGADEVPAVDTMVAVHRPAEPVHCLRPDVIARTARHFVAAFPGDVLYAVKCNPEPRVLRALWAGGVRHFDCASAAEVRLVRLMFPEAAVHFMHPVKARDAIREAAHHLGVTDFVFDSAAELAKILEETAAADADDLGLIVRLAVEGGEAAYGLGGKFGAAPAEAATLLAAARPRARRLGISFHVGSQCLEPAAYTRALVLAGRVAAQSGVVVDVFDVGGGFPVSYADTVPPAFDDFLAAIEDGVRAADLPATSRLWCEPGRALVAAGTSVVVQVQLRRGDDLYVNDGVYGSLSDAGAPRFRFPVRLIRPDGDVPSSRLVPYRLFGPTCDSADRMDGPFLLPADIRDGDWIEVGQLGAYGAALRTAFNGFDRARLVDVLDPPLLETPGYPLSSSAGASPRDLYRAKEYAR